MSKRIMQRMKIDDVCLEVASHIYNQNRGTAPTTIRTCVNDALDYWEKEGLRVSHNYSQPKAVKRVRDVVEILTKMNVPQWYKKQYKQYG